MNNIIITNGKFLKEEFNENLNTKILKEISSEDFLSFLGAEVLFEESLTVEGFFEALKPYFDIINQVFKSYTRGFNLEPFYEEMLKEPEIDEIIQDVKYIEFYWVAEKSDWEDRVHSKEYSDFYIYSSYHGVVENKESANYSMSFVGLNNWKQYPLKLNTEIVCTEFKDGHNVLFSSTKKWSLFELLSDFLKELTFYGYPNHAKKVFDDLKERSENIKSEDCVSWEVVKLEWLEEELEEAKAIENYEGMRKIQEEIDKIKKEIEENKKEDGQENS